jgi:hypothetical protein
VIQGVGYAWMGIGACARRNRPFKITAGPSVGSLFYGHDESSKDKHHKVCEGHVSKTCSFGELQRRKGSLST